MPSFAKNFKAFQHFGASITFEIKKKNGIPENFGASQNLIGNLPKFYWEPPKI